MLLVITDGLGNARGSAGCFERNTRAAVFATSRVKANPTRLVLHNGNGVDKNTTLFELVTGMGMGLGMGMGMGKTSIINQSRTRTRS